MSIRKTNPTGTSTPPASPSKRDSKRARVFSTPTLQGNGEISASSAANNGNGLDRPKLPALIPRLSTAQSSSGSNDEPAPHESLLADDDFAGLESSLPPVTEELTDEHAITQEETTGPRKSSLYVDAFKLALDTVLEDESYLFDEEEHEIFRKYRDLDYEAQYLYVRLFLRKTDAWFRMSKLGYFYDIKDMPTACSTLQSPSVGFADTSALISTIDEAASLLTLEELKTITKEAKLTGSSKAQLINALRRSCNSQSSITHHGRIQQSTGANTPRTAALISKILSITGPCIRLNSATSILFNRVHLVFYRSTEWTEKSLTTLILSRILKRNFPIYLVCRTSNIFPTRTSLLDFEQALKLQSDVDNLLENNGVPSRQDLEEVIKIMESIYSHWESLCAQHANRVDELDEMYLRRFSAGWVYTRIVHKGVYCISRAKDYQRERKILLTLLGQRLYHPSRRGAWYQRLALIEEHYFHDQSSAASKKTWLRTALGTCEKGLQDPATHVVYHYDLQKRITKLEKKLNIAKREQHLWVWSLQKATSTRTIVGTRLNPLDESDPEASSRLGQKTIWRLTKSDDNDNDEGSVEEMCLQHYRTLGYKGFHAENGILKTIFAYLFYDILFLPLPNVFQTAFQTCPLDLHTDSFYMCRMSEINHRLVEIENGGGERLIREVWERERDRETCVVGLDWGFDVEDLVEVVKCLGGGAVAVVCRVLAQEYGVRGSGMPDLVLWKVAADDGEGKGEAMFAEVKSENDRLSDKQRVWIDVLTGAGVMVELCLAVDGGRNGGGGGNSGRGDSGEGKEGKERRVSLGRKVSGGR